MEAAASINQRPAKHQKEPLAGAFFWVLAFFFVYCARPEDWIPGVAHIHPAMIVGIFALVAFILSAPRLKEGLPKEVFLLILLLVQLAVASILSPVWQGGAVQQTITFSKMVLIVVVMGLTVTSVARFRKLIFVQTAAVVAVAMISIRFEHLDAGRLEGVLNGIYGNPNDLAIAIVLALPVALVFLLRARGVFRKAIWSLATVGMLYALFRTGSRAGFIALLVATALCMWEFGFKRQRLYLPAVALLTVLVLFLVAGRQVGQRLSDTFGTGGNYESAHASEVARRQLLERSLEVTGEHPLFGVGPGNFQVVSGTWQPTHNVYTTLSSEGGIPALILFLLIYWQAFANLRRVRRSVDPNSELGMFASAVRASLWAFAFAAPFFPDAYQYFVYFMFAFTTALAAIALRGGEPAGAAAELSSGGWESVARVRAAFEPGAAVHSR